MHRNGCGLTRGLFLAGMVAVLSIASLAAPDVARSVRGHLSSKTPYEAAKPLKGGIGVVEGIPEGSKHLYLYMLSRHGSRWPTWNNVERLKALEKVFEVANPSEGFAWVKRWRFVIGNPGQLHAKGKAEMESLGARFGAYFPDLLQQPYDASSYNFISTQVERAANSALAFGRGLFPCIENAPGTQLTAECIAQRIVLTMRPAANDSLLRFYKWCPAYSEYRDLLDPTIFNHSAFQQEEWTQVCWARLIPKVQQKLGLPSSVVTADTVGSLWKLCQQEASILDVHDQACGLFDNNDVSMLEYCDDVKHFEAHGHANCRAYAMATTLGADLASNLQKAASSGGERARFYFAHDHTLAGFAAWLGLFGSPGPCQLDPKSSMAEDPLKVALAPPPAERSWYGSAITPFAANLAVLVFQLPWNGPLRVRLLWNEQAIPIPWCSNQIDCGFSEFLGGLEQSSVSSFEEVCSLSQAY